MNSTINNINNAFNNGELNIHQFTPTEFTLLNKTIKTNNNSDFYFKLIEEILLLTGPESANKVNSFLNKEIFSTQISYNGDGSIRNVLLPEISKATGHDIRAYFPRNISNYFNLIIKIMGILNIDLDVDVKYEITPSRERKGTPSKNFINKPSNSIPVFDEDRFIELGFSNNDLLLIERKNIQNYVAHLIGKARVSINKTKRADIKNAIRAY